MNGLDDRKMFDMVFRAYALFLVVLTALFAGCALLILARGILALAWQEVA